MTSGKGEAVVFIGTPGWHTHRLYGSEVSKGIAEELFRLFSFSSETKIATKTCKRVSSNSLHQLSRSKFANCEHSFLLFLGHTNTSQLIDYLAKLNFFILLLLISVVAIDWTLRAVVPENEIAAAALSLERSLTITFDQWNVRTDFQFTKKNLNWYY